MGKVGQMNHMGQLNQARHLSKGLLKLVSLLLLSGFVKAETLTTLSTELPTKGRSPLDGISLSLDLSTSSNLVERSSDKASRSETLDVVVKKTFSSKDSLALQVGVSHQSTGLEKTELADSALIYTFEEIELTNDEGLTYSSRLHLPSSEASQDASLLAGLSGRLQLSSKMGLWGRALTAIALFDVLKLAHEFETNAEGEGNLSHRGRLASSVELSLTDTFSISLSGYYQVGRTYQNVTKTKFNLSQELSYKFQKPEFTLYVAHTNEGNALGPNGSESNVSFYDQGQSEFSTGVRASF